MGKIEEESGRLVGFDLPDSAVHLKAKQQNLPKKQAQNSSLAK